MTEEEVRQQLRTSIGRYWGGARHWAKQHGFSPAFVSSVLSGRKKPSRRMCADLGVTDTPFIRYRSPNQPKDVTEQPSGE